MIQGADHVLLKNISTSALNRGNLFILNVYRSRRKNHSFTQIIRKTARASKRSLRTPLLVVRNFDAPHFAGGYGRCNAKGLRLWLGAQRENLTLLTDVVQATRQGTATSYDNTPDLTFSKPIGLSSTWNKTKTDLCCDHTIPSTEKTTTLVKQKTRLNIKITQCDGFRKCLKRHRKSAKTFMILRLGQSR